VTIIEIAFAPTIREIEFEATPELTLIPFTVMVVVESVAVGVNVIELTEFAKVIV
jgi:hypothetical protein